MTQPNNHPLSRGGPFDGDDARNVFNNDGQHDHGPSPHQNSTATHQRFPLHRIVSPRGYGEWLTSDEIIGGLECGWFGCVQCFPSYELLRVHRQNAHPSHDDRLSSDENRQTHDNFYWNPHARFRSWPENTLPALEHRVPLVLPPQQQEQQYRQGPPSLAGLTVSPTWFECQSKDCNLKFPTAQLLNTHIDTAHTDISRHRLLGFQPVSTLREHKSPSHREEAPQPHSTAPAAVARACTRWSERQA